MLLLALAALSLPAKKAPIWERLKHGMNAHQHCDPDPECGGPAGDEALEPLGVPGSPGLGARGWATAERYDMYRSPPLAFAPFEGDGPSSKSPTPAAGIPSKKEAPNPGLYNSAPRYCASPNCPGKPDSSLGRCSYSHCCCATVPKYEGEARRNWIEQVALKLREAANAMQPLMPSDVHVDHTATACEGGDCPLLRRNS